MVPRDPRELAERYGPPALVALVVVFMFWVRMRPAGRVITDSAVYFSGNDAWYHKRMVELAVRHFPATTPFDPWSYFPYGTGHHSGFGGLFDQIVALAALIVGLGDPSEHLVDVTLAVAPPVFGALTAIPTYLIARRLTDRWSGILAAVVLSLLGGGILSRTVVGMSDHQSAEALFGAIAVVGFVYAVAAAYRESPMLEDVQDGNWEFLSTTALAAVWGGVAVAAYLALWSPGVMLLFTFGVFVVIQMARDHVAGRATDHLAFATVVSMATAGVLTLLYARTYTIDSWDFSLLQPFVAFGLAIGTLVLFWFSRYAEGEGYERRYYPPAVLAVIAGSLIVGWVVYPRSIGMLQSLVSRVYSFGLLTSTSSLTVQEIQPATVEMAIAAFGAVFPLAILGLLLMAYHVYEENRPVELLVILWSLTMLSAYFTMVRFGYYLAVNVAILSTYAIWWAATRWLAIDVDLDGVRDVEVYQVIGVLVIVMLIVPGNVVAMSGSQPVWDTSPRLGGTDQAWYDGLSWMQGNTPTVPLDYYGQYDRPQDGDYDYSAETYGVMSWWDYGHWITVMGHRVPYANPFQQNPRPASAYFQATNESRAELILEALPSSADSPASVADMSEAELRELVDSQTEQQASEDGKYVVIDDQMAGEKFPAIAQWEGPEPSAYFQSSRVQIGGQNATLTTTSQRYDRTMLATLYYQDARTLEHYRLVHEVDQYSIVGGYVQGQRASALRTLRLRGNWNDVASTADQVRRARSAGQALSLGPGSNQYVYDAEVESRVKVYERVEGATISGTVPDTSNTTPVFAILQLQTHTGRNFTYVQQTTTDQDGSFSMTVPYATDDTVGPSQGGTNASVEPLGDYDVVAGIPFAPSARGSTEVPEQAIYEGGEVSVTLEPTEGGNESSGGNESTTSGSGTQGSGSGGTGTSGSDNATAGALVSEPRRATARP